MRLKTIFLVVLAFNVNVSARAGSATWNALPVDNDWYNAENWTPMTVPNGPNDMATVGSSTVGPILFPEHSATELDSLILHDDAQVTLVGFITLIFGGAGLSGDTFSNGPDLQAGSSLIFRNSAVCGIDFYNYGSITFEDTSSCGYIRNRNEITFRDSSVSDGVECGSGSVTSFEDQSVAQDAGFSVGGVLYFNDDSTADGASVSVGGVMDISGHNPGGLAIELLGFSGGDIYLGSNNLSVTKRDAIFNFSGSFHDGGVYGGAGGSLTKVGGSEDILGLTGASDYSGGTFIEGGVLLIKNTTGSATGSGPVQVNEGVLEGGGTVTGPVIIGAKGAIVPGNGKPEAVTFVITNSLELTPHSQYRCGIDSQKGRTARIRARGVTIQRGAAIKFSDRTGGQFAVGRSFTIIDNTSNAPIAGTFRKLPKGSKVTVGNNIYEASYSGGGGNDLTLTVVE